VNAKNNTKKKDSPAGVPAGEDAIDIRPVDIKNNKDYEGDDKNKASPINKNGPILGVSKAQNDSLEEEAKGRQVERTKSQASRTLVQNQSNFCPTY